MNQKEIDKIIVKCAKLTIKKYQKIIISIKNINSDTIQILNFGNHNFCAYCNKFYICKFIENDNCSYCPMAKLNNLIKKGCV